MARNTSRKTSVIKKEQKEFEEEVIQIDRVTRVVKGGRKLRFRATVVIGNRNGKVGLGIGKSNEVTGAIQKAIAQAKKDILNVKLNGSTIPHSIQLKYKAAKILLMPAAPGTGLIAGGSVRKVLDLAGVKDILSKAFGNTNKVNNSRATFEALKKLRTTPAMERAAKTSAKTSANTSANTSTKQKAEATEATPSVESTAPEPVESTASEPIEATPIEAPPEPVSTELET